MVETLSNTTIYILIGVVVVLVVFYFLLRKKQIEPTEIRTRKYSDFRKERNQMIVEQKIRVKEAQEELEKLRHQDKLRALEQKMEDNKQELLRLKRGR